MMTNSKSRPITLTLSDNHLRMMVENHLLKSEEIDEIRARVRDIEKHLGLKKKIAA